MTETTTAIILEFLSFKVLKKRLPFPLQVLKALHKKSSRGGQSDYRLSKRRMYGSVSSLPSSVCSRPVYRDRRRNDDRRKSKEAKVSYTFYETAFPITIKVFYDQSTNKRFQRLESHVVTLARSVAHLSSEMRTQHLMIQVCEAINIMCLAVV